MSLHESGVNYQNLIRDLADMYPFDVGEVVVVELVANSLDAGATRISVEFDPESMVLTITDNGKGMDASQFEQYHDFAAGLKTRGTGIGFAGVGAKIAFNIADRVVTETRGHSFAGGSNWHLESKKKLLWEDIEPVHLQGLGSRVEVHFTRGASLPFASTDDLVGLLRRQYLPLVDSHFLTLYGELGYYSSQLEFAVNGRPVKPGYVETDLALEKVRKFFPKKAGKRIGYGVFGVASTEYPLGPDVCGVLLCTRGKVIKADLFNQFPGSLGPRLFGLVEIPGLVNFLTTSKTDFFRQGRHRDFEALYGPIRQEFRSWLAELGVQQTEAGGTDEGTRLERELKRILDDVPELADFFGFRSRAQVLQPSGGGSVQASAQDGTDLTLPAGEGTTAGGLGPLDAGDDPGQVLVADAGTGTQSATPVSRVARRGPKISFAEAPDRLELAWVDGSNVTINSAHPSYIKVRSDNSARRLQNLFAIASAVQRFLSDPEGSQDVAFVDRMLAAWGNK